MMFFPIKTGPNIKKWWEKVMAREACKKGMNRLKKEEDEQISKSKI
jgi:hypothetical protein